MIIERIYSATVDQTLYYFSGNQDAGSFYGYGDVNPSSAATALQEQDKLTFYFYKNISNGYLSMHVVYNAYGVSSGEVRVRISGLSNDAFIAAYDDPEGGVDTYSLSNGVFEAFHQWENNTDGFAIDNINDSSTIVFEVLENNVHQGNQLDQYKFVNNIGEESYLPIAGNEVIEFEILQDDVGNLITMIPSPGEYVSNEMDVNAIVSPDVQNFVYTKGNNTPVISEYISYDQLNPPNPITAVVQDGIGGRVVLDAGFPKLYNVRWNVGWQTFGQLSGTMKYFYNVIDWIMDNNKILAGNRKILVLNDRVESNNSYALNLSRTGFKRTIQGICSILGYQPTFRPLDSFSGNIIDFDYNYVNSFAAVILISSAYTSAKLISDRAVNSILNFRNGGGGLFTIADHGSTVRNDYLDEGFYRTSNEVIRYFNARFWGNYNRGPVTFGFLRNTYGDHPLFQNIGDDETFYGGASESQIILNSLPIYEEFPGDYHETGITTYNFLITRVDQQVVNERYTYSMATIPPVSIVDEEGDPTNQSTTINSRLPLYTVLDSTYTEMFGLVKMDQYVVGEVNVAQPNMPDGVTLYDIDGLVPLTETGQIIIDIITPVSFTNSLTVSRTTVDIENELSLSRASNKMRVGELQETHPFKVHRQFQDNLSLRDELKAPLNLLNFIRYMERDTTVTIPTKFNFTANETRIINASEIIGDNLSGVTSIVGVNRTENCSVTLNSNNTLTVSVNNTNARFSVYLEDSDDTQYIHESIYISVA